MTDVTTSAPAIPAAQADPPAGSQAARGWVARLRHCPVCRGRGLVFRARGFGDYDEDNCRTCLGNGRVLMFVKEGVS